MYKRFSEFGKLSGFLMELRSQAVGQSNLIWKLVQNHRPPIPKELANFVYSFSGIPS